MYILRKTEGVVAVANTKVGDQIKIDLEEFGEFTLTAQKISREGIWFLFDNIVTKRAMNRSSDNLGGFKQSDLERWLSVRFFNLFPEEYRKRIKEITLPSFGQIFGHGGTKSYADYYEPDNDEQFILMKDVTNRISVYVDHLEDYWLRNFTKKELSDKSFVFAASNGDFAGYRLAYADKGVRPLILLETD